jgi:single-stranded DNA-specific DHH superfamily exonuclease
MLSEKQIFEIREHLARAQNPVIFYDNDVDGLCSYVLLRRFLGRGKGVAVKSHPDINPNYARKVQELGGDYVFVLDRHSLGKEFVDEIKNLQIPIVWIDHHDVEDVNYDYENIFYFNPMKNKKRSNEPTTYLIYKTTNKKEDLWIALMGCVADHYLPKFSKDFAKKYPEYWGKNIKKPFDAYYSTGLGRFAKSLSFGLKDTITHVVQLQNFLINVRNPSDIELELDSSSAFAKKYKEIYKKYSVLLEKAKNCVEDGIVFFNYGGDMSMSSDIADYLSHIFEEKVIVVAYSSGPITNISMRGKNVRKMLLQIIDELGKGTGGGHEEAVGARIETKDLEMFRELIGKYIEDDK